MTEVVQGLQALFGQELGLSQTLFLSNKQVCISDAEEVGGGEEGGEE